ncbi:competence protein ComEA [Bifidobacterium goeldii]|uniref:Competence protein ComEA n=2 Tax=Bifidobacterium goeldii TaxID=2306975 RepID=A0A430FKP0_9BIFI|nr:competence protein ComEA [Bifidobacterium goeldii]
MRGVGHRSATRRNVDNPVAFDHIPQFSWTSCLCIPHAGSMGVFTSRGAHAARSRNTRSHARLRARMQQSSANSTATVPQPVQGTASAPVTMPATTTIIEPDSAQQGSAQQGTQQTDGTAYTLAALIGVRADDGLEERTRVARDRPRWRFKPFHAVIAIMALTCALCASLTMLIQQATRYATVRSSVTTSSATSDQAATSNESPTDARSNTQSDTQSDAQSDTPADTGIPVNEPVPNDQTPSIHESPSDASSNSDAHNTSSPTTQPVDERIDLNTANIAQLQAVKGIGPVTAQRIIDHRTSIGRFTSVDQLLDVKGIGTKTLEKIRPWVRV